MFLKAAGQCWEFFEGRRLEFFEGRRPLEAAEGRRLKATGG